MRPALHVVGARLPWPTVNLLKGTCKVSTQPVILSEANRFDRDEAMGGVGFESRASHGAKPGILGNF